MVNRQAFGRRVVHPRPQSWRAPLDIEGITRGKKAPLGEASVSQPLPPSTKSLAPPPDRDSSDPELEAWTRARKRGFRIPWRQLSLMASLCFGIASFVLPESVNDKVDWLLWGLAAMSAYAWFAGRKKPVKDSAAP